MPTDTPTGVILLIKVTPKSSKEGIVGWEGDVLKIKVSAPPDKGAANAAVIAYLARLFGLPQRHIVLVSGATSRMKRLLIENTTYAHLLPLLPPQQTTPV